MKSLKISLLLYLIVTLFGDVACAQSVGKKIVVEHFTNTLCGICASRNPGFYTALRPNSDVIHIAYHPSSPYSSCLFNNQNRAENDSRTRHHDVFGGTPTFIINGALRGTSAVQNATVYNEFRNQTSPLSLKVSLIPSGPDSLEAMVEVQAVDQHNFDTLFLFVPMVEDTVFYAAPNGENTHYDVFRKSFTGTESLKFKAPIRGGNAFKYNKMIARNSIWEATRLYTIAIISDVNRNVVQTERSPLFKAVLSLSVKETANDLTIVFPNPATNLLKLKSEITLMNERFVILDLLGRVKSTGQINDNESIDISELIAGQYLIKIETDSKLITKLFYKL